MSFPSNFVWGTATASYQIEGAPYKQGAGRSVWDMFCMRPDTVYERANGDLACDHFNRYKQDVALMAELGIKAYRLSVSWPRVIPAGVGEINAPGLEFYDRLIDELIGAGITPYVTLFHWDFPYDLYCKGGWLNRDSADWMADYTRVIVDKLSDRVKHWMTLNEPQCFIILGHKLGVHAPGDKLGTAEVLRAGHHALLAHGKAVQTIRAYAKQPVKVGYAPVGGAFIPESDSPADVEAARASAFDETTPNLWANAWWMDPVYGGAYPAGALDAYAADAPPIKDGDMATIYQPMDFFGCNIYQAPIIKAGADGKPVMVRRPDGFARTSIGWPVTPECLYWAPKFFYERYNMPVYVTENGLSNNDWVSLDGKVHDPQRIDYLERHLLQLKRAIADNVEVAGYFHWSFMDNFEWAEGYKERFGLVHVDYATQARTPKDSAYRYREVIRSNGEIKSH
jgi:beta-glucosidase